MPKAYGSQLVYLCVYLYVCNLDFFLNQVLENAVQEQCNNISDLIVLDFLIKVLFTIYGMIGSPQTLLWCIPDSPEDISL